MAGTSATREKVTAAQHLAVIDLLSQYAHRVDDREFDRCASLFHPACVLTFAGTPYTGVAAIREWQDETLLKASPGCHMTSNPEVWRENGRLKSLSDFALIKKPAGTWIVLARGRWADEFHEDEDGAVTFLSRDISFTLSSQ
jgi:hypothetical protein